MIWRECRQVVSVITYCSQGSCAECLLYKTHCCAEYLVGEASVVQDCSQDLLETLSQSFPDSTRGLKFQTTFFCAKSLSILALSHAFMNAFSSLAAPTKFAPFSLMIVFGCHVLLCILSLQLDMTRCPRTVRL